MIKTVDPKTLKTWLDNDEAILIDVRDQIEHSQECIDCATLIPLSEFSAEKVPSTNKKIVIHCRSGARSAAACERLLEDMPNANVYNLEGGILAWAKCGYNSKNSVSTKPCISIERQIFIIVGTFVFIGTLLGYFANSLFLIIPAFFGAGLVFAGTTGCCMMAKMLAHMPWNKNSSCKT
jgi:rhodanese-related sulfurtransferase